MFSAILLFCAIGVYSINNDPSDVLLTALFGLAGYVAIKSGFEPRRCCWGSCWVD